MINIKITLSKSGEGEQCKRLLDMVFIYGKILIAFKTTHQCGVSYATNNLEASIIILCPPLLYTSNEFSFPLLLRSSSYDCVIYRITIF